MSLREFVNNNPYPNYFEMVDRLKKDKEYKLLSIYNHNFHMLCRKIYENYNNRRIILSTLNTIYDNGGNKHLDMFQTIMLFYSPFNTSSNMKIKTYPLKYQVYLDTF